MTGCGDVKPTGQSDYEEVEKLNDIGIIARTDHQKYRVIIILYGSFVRIFASYGLQTRYAGETPALVLLKRKVVAGDVVTACS